MDKNTLHLDIYIKKTTIISFVISVFILALHIFFNIDKLFFVYDKKNDVWYLIKIIFFIVVFASLKLLFYILDKIKDDLVKRGVKIFVYYFAIVLFVQIILWPGLWSHDDIWTLYNAQQGYTLHAWQHVLTSIHLMVFLQFIPTAGGAIIVQNILISLIVSLVILQVEKKLKIEKICNKEILDILLKIIPFLAIPILAYQLSGYRMGLYSYYFILYIMVLICLDEKVTTSKLALIGYLTVMVSTWRTEGIIWLPIGVICVYIKTSKLKMKLLYLLLIVFAYIGIGQYQKAKLWNYNDYSIVATINPGVEAIRASNVEEEKLLLQDIDKVLDLNFLNENPDKSGGELYWTHKFVRKGYSDEEHTRYMKSIVVLMLKHTDVVIKERVDKLKTIFSLCSSKSTKNVGLSKTLFDENDTYSSRVLYREMYGHLRRPIISVELRTNILKLVSGDTNSKLLKMLYILIWNPIFQIIFIIVMLFFTILKKNYYIAFVLLGIIATAFIIALTQPGAWFMYWLPAYLTGSVGIYYFMITFVYNIFIRK